MFQCFHLQSKSPWILEENASDFSWYDQARERPTCQGLINFLWVFLVWSGHFISFCPIILTTLSKPSHAQVFQVLKNQDQETCRGSRHLRFLGNPVCNRGFMKLFGVGKHRFNTLSTSARRGDEYCPYDGRYIARGKRLPTPKWEKVHGFLYQLYQEAGEHIPDKLNSNKRPRHAEKKLMTQTLIDQILDTYHMAVSTTIGVSAQQPFPSLVWAGSCFAKNLFCRYIPLSFSHPIKTTLILFFGESAIEKKTIRFHTCSTSGLADRLRASFPLFPVRKAPSYHKKTGALSSSSASPAWNAPTPPSATVEGPPAVLGGPGGFKTQCDHIGIMSNHNDLRLYGSSAAFVA